jgi:hypothetical protein
MTISTIYEAQARRARETFSDIVLEARILRLASDEPLKLRLEIVDGSVIDVYLSATGKYSYHWERRLIDGTIYRHDNAPHKSWRSVGTFPKHFHDGSEEAVGESHLSDDPVLALEQFLGFVREKLMKGVDLTDKRGES